MSQTHNIPYYLCLYLSVLGMLESEINCESVFFMTRSHIEFYWTGKKTCKYISLQANFVLFFVIFGIQIWVSSVVHFGGMSIVNLLTHLKSIPINQDGKLALHSVILFKHSLSLCSHLTGILYMS